MRTVEVSRFVRAPPAAVERALSPARIVEYEGSFSIREVEEREDEIVVAAGGPGLELALRFEPRENGYEYEQLGEGGPLGARGTTLTCEPENEGTRVRASSSVSLGAPPAAIADRIAGWKRRGELDRLLDALAEDVERSRGVESSAALPYGTRGETMSEHDATFAVEGVESDDDARAIEDELSDLEGTIGTTVDRESGEVAVKLEDELLSEERIEITIDELGYEVE